jgi:hypothetical protein
VSSTHEKVSSTMPQELIFTCLASSVVEN